MHVTSYVQKTEKIFASLIQALTSKARVLNPKACGVQGRSPKGGCVGESLHQFFVLTKGIKCFSTNLFKNFISGHIYVKDAECAETNGK